MPADVGGLLAGAIDLRLLRSSTKEMAVKEIGLIGPSPYGIIAI
jgi:hypothetical protein